jgi:hypothetical protein
VKEIENPAAFSLEYVSLCSSSFCAYLLVVRYHLVAADFSEVSSLRQKLEESELDYSCPTLVLAECALVYANADKVGLFGQSVPTSQEE